jgi:hypothetical protein
MLSVLLCLSSTLFAQEETSKKQSSHHKHLEPLQGFLGDWELTGEIHLADQPEISFVFHRHLGWTLGRNYIQTSMVEMVDGKKVLRHKSMIGWEPEENTIREWGFWNTNLPVDNPAVAETATWTKDGDTWLIENEKVKGVYTIIDSDNHRYDCKFGGDDGKENSWYFVAKRVAEQK